MTNKERYRLGLDLGTNSIGWAIYSLDNNNNPGDLLDMGVRIFSDGRNPKTKEPLAVERRTARGIRRQLYRRKLRRRKTFRLLQSQGLFPQSKEECILLKSLNPYELRIKALDTILQPYELGRVLFNLSVRRGFLSNRKDGTREDSDNNTSKKKSLSQADKCNELLKAIKESSSRTIGEYLWNTREEHNGIRFAPNRMDYYPLRSMYIDEFNLIRQKQETTYKDVDWDAIYDSLFHQRPLRPQERGYCQYMTDKKRTYKAMPSSEKLRVLQDVRNLTYQTEDGKTRFLSETEEDIIIDILYNQATAKFDALKKKIGLSAKCIFNLESEIRTELKGCPTAVKMRNEKHFGPLWDTLSLAQQDDIVETLIFADEDKEVENKLKDYTLSEEQIQNITKIILVSGTTMLCKEVSQKLVALMESKEMRPIYTTAVQMLGYKYADQSVQKFDLLPYYGKVLVGSTMGIKPDAPESLPEAKYGKISNPTVHIALNQTRVVVNAVIKKYGKPQQIVVELSRDLKASKEQKSEIMRRQSDNKKQNDLLNIKIKDVCKTIEYPNRIDRLKFKLWEELGTDGLARRCLYCGKNISGQELFSKNIEIEHILPYGRTLMDSESNLTVAHASCNAFKTNKSPFEAFGNNPKGYNWNEILERANSLKNPQKRTKFAENAMTKFEEDSNFIQRQLTDNQYLSKAAMRYLKSVCDDVWAVTGGMTKLLRDKWNIDSILKRKIDKNEIAMFNLKEEQIGTYKKNRYDHRHHALDASVIALIDRGMVQEISHLNKINKKNTITVPEMAVPRSVLIQKVQNIIPSFKPDHGVQGKLSKETLLGKIKQERLISISEIKTADDISKIKSDKVRTDFEEVFAENNDDIKKTVKALKDIYPQVKIYEEVYVSRTAITSLKENNIKDIVDIAIQNKLTEYIAHHKGIKFENNLQTFSDETGIKKVRCINRVQKPIEIKGSTPRYLAPEDYFAAIIWQLPPKKAGGTPSYQAQYIRRDEVDKNSNPISNAKPDAAAKKIGTIYKGDYLELTEGEDTLIAKVFGYSATLNLLDVRPVWAVTDTYDWLITTSEPMTQKGWKPQKKQNYISVNVLFGQKKARMITVDPLGTVYKK